MSGGVRFLIYAALLTFGVAGAGSVSAADNSQLELMGGPAVSQAPLAAIVHGMNPTPGGLDPLADDLIERGFRSYLFHYDSEERLDESARQLSAALGRLIQESDSQRLVVVGYSMGGLIARRALTEGHFPGLDQPNLQFDLITIASPLGGFRSANWSWLSFGFGAPVYRDLGTRSRFIQEPGDLAANVRHIKIETLEKGAVRLENGGWVDDHVVGLESQIHPVVDQQAADLNRLMVGHTNVVNAYGYVHPELVDLLDGVLHGHAVPGLKVSSQLEAGESAATNP
jgi:hypothetical protein